MNKNYITLIIALAIIAAGTVILHTQKSIPVRNASNVHFQFISSLELPNDLSWCGEQIPMDDPEVRERAEREFYLLLQQPGQIMLYIKRSGRYFPMYEKAAKELGAPDDLKYLSVAESALYMSESHAGAVGLWQFMPATAKMMGLHVSSYVDERRHPEKSTYAGIKYMQQHYKRFGSWFLAAAAYNMGLGRVGRTLDFQQGEDYFDLHLNSETSRYIFRIAIIKELMANAQKYGFIVDEDDLYKDVDSQIITVKTEINDLSAWANAHGTNYKMVKRLNPWIIKESLRPPLSGESYEIRVPAI